MVILNIAEIKERDLIRKRLIDHVRRKMITKLPSFRRFRKDMSK